MGNLPSKEGSIDNSQRRIRPINSYQQSQASLDESFINNRPFSTTSTRLLPQKKSTSNNKNQTIVVSPVRHDLVLTDHVTPLVSLSAASMNHNNIRRSSSTTAQQFYKENQEKNKLSTSLPNQISTTTTMSDGFIINTSIPTISHQLDNNFNKKKNRESKDAWVYEYGAEKERDRQTRQHYVLKQVFNGNLHVTLNEPTRILDSACGVGLWSLEVADNYPNCQIIGIDVVPPSDKEGWNFNGSSAGQINHNNVKFQQGDILQKQLSFPDDHFDLVYQRDVATVLPFDAWPNLIKEFFRITKPGGQIQLVEYDLLFKNPGPVLTQVNEWYCLAASTIGVNPTYSDYILDYLEEAGFINISIKNIDIPIGEWPSTDREKQYGYLYKEQMKALFKSMKRWWCTEIKVSQQEYDRVCNEALEEFEVFKSTAKWKIFTAEKPTI